MKKIDNTLDDELGLESISRLGGFKYLECLIYFVFVIFCCLIYSGSMN